MSNANARMLPDAYAKSTGSNNYKLLRLLEILYENHKADLESINRAKDINFATGVTLDNIGAMAGVKRNGDTDAQYRLAILSRVAALATTGDADATIARIEQMFGLERGTISVIEPPSVPPASVFVLGLTMDLLQSSKYTSEQIEALIQSVIPAGVMLYAPRFGGTLRVDSSFTMMLEDYPTLYTCWLNGQKALVSNNEQIGLAGAGEVPESFADTAGDSEYAISGTYEGGTLGISTGEDVMEVS